MEGSPFRPAAGRYTTSAVLAELGRLWDRAVDQTPGKGPARTQKLLAHKSGVPESTVNSWSTGTSLPQSPDQLHKVGRMLAGWAGEEPPTVRQWEQRLREDQAARGVPGEGRQGPVVGRLIAGLTDPFVLEIHRPVDAGPGLPVLPPYIRRDHDTDLAQVTQRAASGHSAMAVLVGRSSTGKTRACWEAIHLLPLGWRLWHPFDPTRPEAVLAELPRVGPRTVVWLNETQLYVHTPGDTGERVAARAAHPAHRPRPGARACAGHAVAFSLGRPHPRRRSARAGPHGPGRNRYPGALRLYRVRS